MTFTEQPLRPQHEVTPRLQVRRWLGSPLSVTVEEADVKGYSRTLNAAVTGAPRGRRQRGSVGSVGGVSGVWIRESRGTVSGGHTSKCQDGRTRLWLSK